MKLTTFALTMAMLAFHCAGSLAQEIANDPNETWQQAMDRIGQQAGAGQFEEALESARQALTIAEANFAADDRRLSRSLLVISSMLFQQGQLAEAEKLAVRAHELIEQRFVDTHAELATSHKFLGNLNMMRSNLDAAEANFAEAIRLSELALGANHPETAKHIGNLAALLLKQEKWAEARPLLNKTLDIWQQQETPHPVYMVTAMTNLAALHTHFGELDKAQELYEQGLAIQEAAFGSDNPRLANILRNYASFLRESGKDDKAKAVEQRFAELTGK